MCAAIKQMDVGANVVLITTPAAAEFVRGLGIVDEVVAFDKRGAHPVSYTHLTLPTSDLV